MIFSRDLQGSAISTESYMGKSGPSRLTGFKSLGDVPGFFNF